MAPAEGQLKAYFRTLQAIPPMTPEEEAALLHRLVAGDPDARQRFICANLRFVVTIARRCRGRKVPLEDLIAAGNLGLLIGLERFDAARGVRFTSYAAWWIRNLIRETQAELTYTIRLPDNRIRLLQGLSAAREEAAGPGRPGVARLAERLDITIAQLRDTQAQAQDTRSLHAACGEDGSHALLDVIADETAPPPDRPLLREEARRTIRQEIDALEAREATVIRLFYGFDTDGPETLAAIGARMNLSRERVRQIKEKALNRLRHPARRARLAALRDAD